VSALGTVNAAGAAVATKPGGKTTVTVGDNYYKPEDIEITAGTKVTWANKGRILHSVTPDKGKLYGAKTLPKGKKYSFTFKKPGTYAYHCTFHGAPGSGQHGTIVVKAAAPPTTTTTAGP
jgi:plastocyanin